MNDVEIAQELDIVPIAERAPDFVLAIDPVTGEQIKIQLAGTGEFSQDLDDAPVPEGVTIH